jgi:hypothetical protein
MERPEECGLYPYNVQPKSNIPLKRSRYRAAAEHTPAAAVRGEEEL